MQRRSAIILPDHFMTVIRPSTAASSSDEVVRNSSYTEKSLVTTIRAFADRLFAPLKQLFRGKKQAGGDAK